jgi:hypothetical protein
MNKLLPMQSCKWLGFEAKRISCFKHSASKGVNSAT